MESSYTPSRSREDILSSILNWVCPECGGRMGGLQKEFECQGQCRRDWRCVWENNPAIDTIQFTGDSRVMPLSARLRRRALAPVAPGSCGPRRLLRLLRRFLRGADMPKYFPDAGLFRVAKRLSSITDRGCVQQSFQFNRSSRNTFRGTASRSPRSSRAFITRCLIGLCTWTFMVATPASAENSGSDTSAGMSTVLISPGNNSSAIVIGFLGGFVPRDEPHHPEVQMMHNLRQEYPSNAYFGLFENSKVGEVYKIIQNRLDADQDGTLSDEEKRRARILLFGHSWGASAVVALSRKLKQMDVPVMLTVQVDSGAKPFHNDRVIPSNVLQAANFYQTRGLIHGRSKIIAADPSHTTILGNFRWEYKHEPAACRSFPWRARFFTKGHIEIECDPQVWSQVQTLLRRSLRNSLVNETDAAEPDIQSSDWDGSAVR
jgi:hypothetical protein